MTEPQELGAYELVEPEFSPERVAEMHELSARAGLVEDGESQ